MRKDPQGSVRTEAINDQRTSTSSKSSCAPAHGRRRVAGSVPKPRAYVSSGLPQQAEVRTKAVRPRRKLESALNVGRQARAPVGNILALRPGIRRTRRVRTADDTGKKPWPGRGYPSRTGYRRWASTSAAVVQSSGSGRPVVRTGAPGGHRLAGLRALLKPPRAR